MDMFERSDVTSRLCGHPPADWNANVFSVSYAADGEQDSVNLRQIMDAKIKFVTFNNDSYAETYADMQMMVELKRRGQAHLADAAWHGQLLPLGHILHDSVADDHIMVIEVGTVCSSLVCPWDLSFDSPVANGIGV
jgi:hypothetical protein